MYELNYIQLKLLSFAVLVVALVLHEIGHGAVALWNGDPTAQRAGRITLNPLSHFDPLGLVMILFLPIGFAKPVPVNPNNFKNLKRGIFTTAVAGVTINLILAFIFTPVYLALLNHATEFALYTVPGIILLNLTMLFCVVNLSLLVFNLLPIFPLDGFRVVESFTRYRNPYCVFMRKNGMYVLLGLFCISVLAEYLPFLAYIDILGFWLQTLMNLIWTPMLWFWGLMI